jgi:hypothetical protein
MDWFTSFGWTVGDVINDTATSLNRAYHKYFMDLKPLPRVWSGETVKNILRFKNLPSENGNYESLKSVVGSSDVSFMLMGLVDETSIKWLSYPDLRNLYQSWFKKLPANLSRSQVEDEILRKEKEVVYLLALDNDDFRQLNLRWTTGEIKSFDNGQRRIIKPLQRTRYQKASLKRNQKFRNLFKVSINHGINPLEF